MDQREGRRALHHERREAGEGHLGEAARPGERPVNNPHTFPHELVGCSETVREFGAVASPTGRGEMICHANDLAKSEEHTSELQSLMRISYAVFCLKKKNKI